MPDAQAQSPERISPDPGWMGCPPAEETRRKLIADVLRAQDVLSETEVREFADAVESALLQATIDAEAMERGAEILTRRIEKVDPTTDPTYVERTTPDPEAWRQTFPPEGSRRKVIYEAIRRDQKCSIEGCELCLRAADEVEAALQREAPEVEFTPACDQSEAADEAGDIEPAGGGARHTLIRQAIDAELGSYFGPEGRVVSRKRFARVLADAVESVLQADEEAVRRGGEILAGAVEGSLSADTCDQSEPTPDEVVLVDAAATELLRRIKADPPDSLFSLDKRVPSADLVDLIARLG